MNVAVVQVPYHAGDDRHPSSAGPKRLLEAGLTEILEHQGHAVVVQSAEREGPFRDTASSTAAVNKRVAKLVRRAVNSNSLPLVIGHCYRNYWSQVGDNTPLAEDTIVMFGVRDVSPEVEPERLNRSRIRIIEWREGEPQGDILDVLDRLASRVSKVYLHVDFDSFAPEVAPGVGDDPVPGGLSREHAE